MPIIFREPDQTLRATLQPGGDGAFVLYSHTFYHSYYSVFAALSAVAVPAGIEPTSSPDCEVLWNFKPASIELRNMAVPTGFEPAISSVTDWRGRPLLYGTI